MIMIITLTLSFLVALNFLLLIFSCNKTTKKTTTESPVVYKTAELTKTPEIKTTISTKQIATSQLAPTGS